MTKVVIHSPSLCADSDLRPLFRQLSIAHSWEVLQLLAEASSTVGRISGRLALAESEVSRSLKHLRQLGLVEYVTIKKHRFYALTPQVRCEQNGVGVRLSIRTDDNTALEIHLERRRSRRNGHG